MSVIKEFFGALGGRHPDASTGRPPDKQLQPDEYNAALDMTPVPAKEVVDMLFEFNPPTKSELWARRAGWGLRRTTLGTIDFAKKNKQIVAPAIAAGAVALALSRPSVRDGVIQVWDDFSDQAKQIPELIHEIFPPLSTPEPEKVIIERLQQQLTAATLVIECHRPNGDKEKYFGIAVTPEYGEPDKDLLIIFQPKKCFENNSWSEITTLDNPEKRIVTNRGLYNALTDNLDIVVTQLAPESKGLVKPLRLRLEEPDPNKIYAITLDTFNQPQVNRIEPIDAARPDQLLVFDPEIAKPIGAIVDDQGKMVAVIHDQNVSIDNCFNCPTASLLNLTKNEFYVFLNSLIDSISSKQSNSVETNITPTIPAETTTAEPTFEAISTPSDEEIKQNEALLNQTILPSVLQISCSTKPKGSPEQIYHQLGLAIYFSGLDSGNIFYYLEPQICVRQGWWKNVVVGNIDPAYNTDHHAGFQNQACSYNGLCAFRDVTGRLRERFPGVPSTLLQSVPDLPNFLARGVYVITPDETGEGMTFKHTYYIDSEGAVGLPKETLLGSPIVFVNLSGDIEIIGLAVNRSDGTEIIESSYPPDIQEQLSIATENIKRDLKT